MTFILKKKDQVPQSFERLLNSMIRNAYNDSTAKEKEVETKQTQSFNPKINIVEKIESLEIQFALPGWVKSEVEINVDQELLIVKGQKSPEVKQEVTYHSYEFDYGNFERRFELPVEKFGEVNAGMTNGILTITIAKKVNTETQRKIAVK